MPPICQVVGKRVHPCPGNSNSDGVRVDVGAEVGEVGELCFAVVVGRWDVVWALEDR